MGKNGSLYSHALVEAEAIVLPPLQKREEPTQQHDDCSRTASLHERGWSLLGHTQTLKSNHAEPGEHWMR